jgi:hypothetical protein
MNHLYDMIDAAIYALPVVATLLMLSITTYRHVR